MLQAFIIMSREGLESFMIVAIILSYLRKTGRPRLVPVVYAGIVTAVLLSMGLGVVLMSVANISLWEGILGLTAVVLGRGSDRRAVSVPSGVRDITLDGKGRSTRPKSSIPVRFGNGSLSMRTEAIIPTVAPTSLGIST